MLTLGSLFDGIGGFPLAAARSGIEPVWASEIKKFFIHGMRKILSSKRKNPTNLDSVHSKIIFSC